MVMIGGINFLIDEAFVKSSSAPNNLANPNVVDGYDYRQLNDIVAALGILLAPGSPTAGFLSALAGKDIYISKRLWPTLAADVNNAAFLGKASVVAQGLQGAVQARDFVSVIPHLETRNILNPDGTQATNSDGTPMTQIVGVGLASAPYNPTTAFGVMDLPQTADFNANAQLFSFRTPSGTSHASLLRTIFHELAHAVATDVNNGSWVAYTTAPSAPNALQNAFNIVAEEVAIDAENFFYTKLNSVSDRDVRIGHSIFSGSSFDPSQVFAGANSVSYDGSGVFSADFGGGDKIKKSYTIVRTFANPGFVRNIDGTNVKFVNYITISAEGTLLRSNGTPTSFLTRALSGIAHHNSLEQVSLTNVVSAIDQLKVIADAAATDAAGNLSVIQSIKDFRYTDLNAAIGLSNSRSKSETDATGPYERTSATAYREARSLYLEAGSASTIVFGASGAREKNVSFASRTDYLKGGSGNDLLLAGQGSRSGSTNALKAGDGSDALRGNTRDDKLEGEGGSDLLFQSRGRDTIDGGDGTDTFVLANGLSGQRVDLSAATGGEVVIGSGADVSRVKNVEIFVGNDQFTTFIGNGHGIFIAGRGGGDFTLKAGDVAVGNPGSNVANIYHVDAADLGRIRIINFKQNDRLYVKQDGVENLLQNYTVTSAVSESRLYGTGNPWDIIANTAGIQTRVSGSLSGTYESLSYVPPDDFGPFTGYYESGQGTAKTLVALIPSLDKPDSVAQFLFSRIVNSATGEVENGLELVISGYRDGYGGIRIRSDQLSLARQSDDLLGYGTYAWSGSQIGDDLRGRYRDSQGIHQYSSTVYSPYDPIWRAITADLAQSSDQLLGDLPTATAAARGASLPDIAPRETPSLRDIVLTATLDPSEYSFDETGRVALDGDGGANTLDAAGQFNTLVGHGGGDTFIVNSGYGVVVIDERDTAPNANNRLILGTGLDLSTAVVFGDMDGNIILDFGGDDAVILQKALRARSSTDGTYGVQSIEGADGLVWSYDDLVNAAISPTEFNDVLIGDARANWFDSQGVGRMVVGNGGGDTIIFELGYGQLIIDERDADANPINLLAFGAGISRDTITVTGDEEGNLVLDLGDGDVIWLLGAMAGRDADGRALGVQSFSFADGTAWSYADVAALAAETPDAGGTVFGDTAGNDFDTMGNATRIVGRGGGDNIYFAPGYGLLTVDEADTALSPDNRLVFGSGIDSASVSVRGTADGDIFIETGPDEGVLLVNALNSGPGVSFGVQSIAFEDGTIWSYADLFERSVTPSAENLSLFGDAMANALDSMGVATHISGGGGGDTIYYEQGYGALTIFEVDAAAAPANTLVLGEGLLRGDLVVTGTEEGDLVLAFGGTDRITLTGALASGNGLTFGMQAINFADGQTLSYADLLAMAGTASASNPHIFGDMAANTLDPLGLATAVTGGGGGDLIHYERGYGAVIIDEQDVGATPANRLRFGAGIAVADLAFSGTDSGDIIINLGNGDTVTLRGALMSLDGITRGIQNFEFADGASLTAQDIVVQISSPTAGAGTLYGSTSSDDLDSLGVASTLVGNGGGDIFRYNAGYGLVTIDERDAVRQDANVLVLGPGIAPGSVSARGTNAGDIVLDFGGTDALTIKGALLGEDESGAILGLQGVVFDDGTVWTYEDLLSMVSTASATQTEIFGDVGSNVLAAAGTAHLLVGNGGGDTFVYNVGDGAVTVDERDRADYAFNRLMLGAGITPETLTASGTASGDIVLDFGGGDSILISNALEGGAGITYGVQAIIFADGTEWDFLDILRAVQAPGPGKPILYGASTADIFDTQGLSHEIIGSGGRDTIYYRVGYGALTIDERDSGASPFNSLILGDGIAPAAVSVAALGNDLVLDLGGGDVITIRDALATTPGITHGLQTIEFSNGTIWTPDLLQSFTANVRDLSLQDGVVDVDFARMPASPLPLVRLDSVAEDVSVTLTPDGLDLLISDGGGTLRLRNFAVSHAFSSQQIQFSGGVVWSVADAVQHVSNWAEVGTVLLGSAAPETFSKNGRFISIEGGGGGDSFIYNRGDGELQIAEADSVQRSDNRIILGSGFVPSDLTVTTEYGNPDTLRLDFGGGDLIILTRGLHVAADSAFGIQRVDFADGQHLTYDDIVALATTGSAANDGALTGDTFANIFDSHGYSRSAIGNGGADTFIYNAGYGHFSIFEKDGSTPAVSILQLGAGLDPLTTDVVGEFSSIRLVFSESDSVLISGGLESGSGVDEVRFADGTVWTRANLIARVGTAVAGVNTIYGDDAPNTLDSAGLAHHVVGNGGGDTIIYNRGYGAVTIEEQDFGPSPANRLQFGAGISPGDVSVRTDGIGSFVLDLGNGDVVRFEGSGMTVNPGSGAIEGLQSVGFADGTIWSYAQLLAIGDAPSPTHQIIFGDLGDNILDTQGVARQVYVRGGDTIVYNPGYGALTAKFLNYTATAPVILSFGSGITSSDLTAGARAGIFTVALGPTDVLTLDDQPDEIRFADGTHWDRAQVSSLFFPQSIANATQLTDNSVLTGGIVKLASSTGQTTPFVVTGALTFADLMPDDHHRAIVTDVTLRGFTNSLTEDVVKGWFALSVPTEATAGNEGSIGWAVTVPGNAFDHLGTGSSSSFAELVYSVQIRDDFGNVFDRDVKVYINNVSTAPTLTMPYQTAGSVSSASFTEAANVTGGFASLNTSGKLKFSGAKPFYWDAASLVSVTASGVTSGLASQSVVEDWLGLLNNFANSTVAGQVYSDTNDWYFDARQSQFDYLAAGEVLQLVYTVEVADQFGTRAEFPISITITGGNDGVVSVNGGTSYAFLMEGQDAQSPLNATGSIRFSDADRSDTHTAVLTGVTASGSTTALPDTATLMSLLSLSGAEEPTSTNNGSVSWSFATESGLFAYLGAGDVLTLNYAIQISDGHGGSLARTVTIFVQGTGPDSGGGDGNHAPVTLVPAEVTATLGTPVAVPGISVADSDLNAFETVTLIADAGRLSVAQTANVSVSGNNSRALTLSGSVADINLALVALHYEGLSPDGDFILVTTSDGSLSNQHGIVVSMSGTVANQSPVIEAGTIATASLEETPGVTASTVSLSAAGALRFSDADAADMHVASLVSVSATGAALGLPSAATQLGWLAVSPVTEPTGQSAGSVGWTFTAPDSAFDYLTSGQNVALAYAVRIDDGHGGSVDQLISITVTGSNDAPIITGTNSAAQLTETPGATGSMQALTATASLDFGDADGSGSHIATVANVAASGAQAGLPDTAVLLALMSVGSVVEPGSQTPGHLNWNFSAADRTFDYLAAGESVELTYTLRLADDQGGQADQNVTITVTGTVDTPVIHVPAAQTPRTNTLTAITGVSITDPDATAMQAVVITTGRGTAGATPVAGGSVVAGGTATAKTLTIQGSLAEVNAALSTLTYTSTTAGTDTISIALNDGITTASAAIATTVSSTAVHAPVLLNGGGSFALSEAAGTTGSVALTGITSSLAFTDIDLPDTHSLTITSVAASGTIIGAPSNATMKSWLAKGAVVEDSRTIAGSVPLTFSATDKSFDYLAAGESLTLSYLLTFADNRAASTTTNLTVTITGENDAPLLATAGTVVARALTERSGLTGSTLLDTTSGTIRFTDADKSNSHTAHLVSVSTSGVTASLPEPEVLATWFAIGALAEPVGTTSGILPWTFSVRDSAFDYLGVGEAVTLTYVVRITDSVGASFDQPVSITVTGTNDKPVAAVQSGQTTDNQTPLVIPVASLLAGATDGDLPDMLSLVSVQGAVNGTVSLAGDLVTFTPTPTHVGPASFTYTISDGKGGTSTAKANVTVNLFRTLGTEGADILVGTTAKSQIEGLGGNDSLTAGSAGDTLLGGSGDDLVNGAAGADTLFGGEGADTIDGKGGNDALFGEAGADSLIGNAGTDTLDGGDGNDRLTGGAGNDTIDGGAGIDTAVFAGLASTYIITAANGTASIVDTAPTADGNDGTDSVTGVEYAVFKGGVQIGLASPIVLDLDGDGVTLVRASESAALFDVDGDGVLDDTSWIASGDGFLMLDRDGNGTVSDFGELSFINDLEGAMSDLAGLVAFDSNQDGLLSSADAHFGEFRIWRDGNGNGSVDNGEIATLPAAGVRSINLAGTAITSTAVAGDGIILNRGSYVTTFGTTAAFADAMLTYSSATAAPIDSAASSASGSDFQHFALDRTSGAYRIEASAGKLYNRNQKDKQVTDARFGDLKVWIDRNADGISQADELKSLVDLGIKEISLRNTATNDTVKPGENLALSTATFTWSNGLTATIGNVALAFTPSADVSDGSVDVAGQIDGAPTTAALAAANLAQAMSGFGADLASGTLRKFDSDGMAAHDWLAASAA